MNKVEIKPAEGKFGIVIPGLGAVGTTFIAGVLLVRKNLNVPVGSLTQMGRIKIGKDEKATNELIKDFVPLADLEDIEFGGWDIFEDNVYEAVAHASVLKKEKTPLR